ncbi:MAG: hypothetical protein AB7S86_10550 [Hydrogenophaga sp.]|uniref:hypothetical protein n=1 Tax=Hydrogenophaga sp. TaxID=1904254 RepID=UPI003D0ED486
MLIHLRAPLQSLLMLCAALAASTGSAADPAPLTQEEALLSVKGKKLSTHNARFGAVALDFRDDGRVYGSNQGGTDSGQWKVEQGRLCLAWRNWDYKGCGVLQKRGDVLEHLHPDGSLHFTVKAP